MEMDQNNGGTQVDIVEEKEEMVAPRKVPERAQKEPKLHVPLDIEEG